MDTVRATSYPLHVIDFANRQIYSAIVVEINFAAVSSECRVHVDEESRLNLEKRKKFPLTAEDANERLKVLSRLMSMYDKRTGVQLIYHETTTQD